MRPSVNLLVLLWLPFCQVWEDTSLRFDLHFFDTVSFHVPGVYFCAFMPGSHLFKNSDFLLNFLYITAFVSWIVPNPCVLLLLFVPVAVQECVGPFPFIWEFFHSPSFIFPTFLCTIRKDIWNGTSMNHLLIFVLWPSIWLPQQRFYVHFRKSIWGCCLRIKKVRLLMSPGAARSKVYGARVLLWPRQLHQCMAGTWKGK